MGKILSCVEGRAPKGRTLPKPPSESDPAPEPTPTSGNGVYEQPSQEPLSYVNAGYWASWQAYDGIFPSNLDASAITHMVYAFADIDGDGSIFLKDEYLHYEIGIDGTNGCLRACTQLKGRNPNLKVILSVGGGGEEVAVHFVDVAGHPSKLQRFSDSAKNLVDMFQLDGIDTDWESPATKQQGLQYLEIIKALRESLPRAKSHLLSVTLVPDPNMLRHIPLSEISKLVDSLNLMA
jgi:chitinase